MEMRPVLPESPEKQNAPDDRNKPERYNMFFPYCICSVKKGKIYMCVCVCGGVGVVVGVGGCLGNAMKNAGPSVGGEVT